MRRVKAAYANKFTLTAIFLVDEHPQHQHSTSNYNYESSSLESDFETDFESKKKKSPVKSPNKHVKNPTTSGNHKPKLCGRCNTTKSLEECLNKLELKINEMLEDSNNFVFLIDIEDYLFSTVVESKAQTQTKSQYISRI